MIGNRNQSLMHLDDLMLCRWENEGGALCPLTAAEVMADRVSHSDDRFGVAIDAERDSRPAEIHRAMGDHPFAEQGACRSYRVNRQLRQVTRPNWRRRRTRGCSRAALAGLGMAC